jgi:hypothetical protein
MFYYWIRFLDLKVKEISNYMEIRKEISMDYHKEKLRTFSKKYLNQDVNYWIKATNLVSDLIYIKEHYRRTHCSDMDIIITPTYGGVIYGMFAEQVFRNLFSWNNPKSKGIVDRVEESLKIIDISCNLSNLIYYNLDKEKEQLYLTDFLEWRKIVKYFTNVDIKENLGCFIGCSSGCEATYKVIDEYEKSTLNIQESDYSDLL